MPTYKLGSSPLLEELANSPRKELTGRSANSTSSETRWKQLPYTSASFEYSPPVLSGRIKSTLPYSATSGSQIKALLDDEAENSISLRYEIKLTKRILKPNTRSRPVLDNSQLARYCYGYIDLLYAWQYYDKRAEMIGMLSNNQAIRHSLVIETYCLYCSKTDEGSEPPTYNSACKTCKVKPSGISCSICQTPVNRLLWFCPECLHGGHAHHMRAWFSNNSECPVGCRCECLLYSALSE